MNSEYMLKKRCGRPAWMKPAVRMRHTSPSAPTVWRDIASSRLTSPPPRYRSAPVAKSPIASATHAQIRA
jgi:hypothetical protein